MSASAVTAPQKGAADQGPKVSVHGVPVPLDWLVVRHDPAKFPASVCVSNEKLRQDNRDIGWAKKREQLFAAAAAGVHLAAFAYNLAFWGFEGMPPDRYWPSNTRLKLGVRPGRYGNLEGSKRVYYDNLAKMEGVD